MSTISEALEAKQETAALERFRRENRDLFQKDDRRLFAHLALALPYDNVERARGRFLKNAELSWLFVTY